MSWNSVKRNWTEFDIVKNEFIQMALHNYLMQDKDEDDTSTSGVDYACHSDTKCMHTH